MVQQLEQNEVTAVKVSNLGDSVNNAVGASCKDVGKQTF